MTTSLTPFLLAKQKGTLVSCPHCGSQAFMEAEGGEAAQCFECNKIVYLDTFGNVLRDGKPVIANKKPVEGKRPDRLPDNWDKFTTSQKHEFFIIAKPDILADVEKMGERRTRAKWGIRPSTWRDFKARWDIPTEPMEEEPGPKAPELAVETVASQAGKLKDLSWFMIQFQAVSAPPMPEFNPYWHPDVQVKWFECYHRILDINHGVSTATRYNNSGVTATGQQPELPGGPLGSEAPGV